MGGSSNIRKVVIPAAGLGTRFLPASKVVPKELFTIVDRPILQVNVNEAIAAGVEEVILIVSPRKKELEKYFQVDDELESYLQERKKTSLLKKLRESQPNVRVTTVIQEEPKGLGHAVLMAREAVGNEPFAVLLPDDLILFHIPCLKQMLFHWEERKLGCVAVRRVSRERISSYGIIGPKSSEGRLYEVQSLVEKPSPEVAPSNLAIVGRYLLPAKTFEILENVSPGAIGEIQLTDALQALVDVEGFLAYEFEGEHYDAGDRLGFIAANVAYGLEVDEMRDELRNVIGGIIKP